jgi:hypothetical protein
LEGEKSIIKTMVVNIGCMTLEVDYVELNSNNNSYDGDVLFSAYAAKDEGDDNTGHNSVTFLLPL